MKIERTNKILKGKKSHFEILFTAQSFLTS